MPRRAKGARLYYRRDKAYYVIRDGNRQLSTGTSDRREAEAALAQYIAEKGRPAQGPRTPDKFTISEALDRYGSEHAPTVKDDSRIGYAIDALLPFFRSLPVASITSEVCRRYERYRERAPATVRRELGVLQAAINFCFREGYLTATRPVSLPSAPPPRNRWLTSNEVEKLLKTAESDPKTEHLGRFIRIAVITGTRSQSLLGLRFTAHTQGGWVDTERGIMYRRADGEVETKKRKPPIQIPRPLLEDLRRWERIDGPAGWVVNFRGNRVGSIKTAWNHTLKRSGIERCTPHDLRRTAITWAMQRGADKWDAAGFFGVSLDVLERVYGHHHPDHMQSAVRAMERKL